MAFNEEQELRERADKLLQAKYFTRRKDDLKAIMSTQEGRRVIAGLFAVTGFRSDIIIDNASKRDWLLGRRSVAVAIFNELKHPELYPLYQLMEKEDIEQQNFDEAEKQKSIETFRKGR
ncbi:MAG: hypothetical protein KGL39_19855 [Patescibacteria group bacterium]|nr:hypothetical protein [Patescibacteria group bacterium]